METEFEFELPRGYVDKNGEVHRRGTMRLATAADEEKSAMDGAVKGLEGWITCFENCHLAGVVRGVGCDGAGSIRNQPELLKTAHDRGKAV